MRTLLLIAALFAAAPFVRAAVAPPQARVEHWPDGSPKLRAQVHRAPSGALVNDGAFVSWHSNGAKESEGLYRDGHREGPWRWWYDSGEPFATATFHAGAGNFRCATRDGKLLREGRYVDDRREGLWTEYWPSGRKRLEGAYVDDLQDGAWTAWTDEDPPRATQVEFRHGERVR